MGEIVELAALVDEIKRASSNLDAGDAKTNARIDQVEQSINQLFLKAGRPASAMMTADDEVAERQSATEMCVIKHELAVPKNDGHRPDYMPSSTEIDEALAARRGLRHLFRHGDPARLDQLERKSLTSFSFGSNSFMLPPEMSATTLRCIVDDTDISGLVNNVTISAGSIKFPIDNTRMETAAWACEASCFANNPSPDLQEGLGELEIKAESLRYIVCAGSDLLQDAAFNVEQWILQRVSEGFRRAINQAIVIGDGIGKPLGLFNPRGGVPICDTSPATQPGQFTWADLVMLKWEVPIQWHPGAVYLMNQRTFAQALTMSDANGRPLMLADPTQPERMLINGSPVVIVNWMINVAPGTCPVGFGNLKQAYTLVTRRATSMMSDPFTAQWCTLFRFDSRVGGAPTCPNAFRLLRIG